MIENVAEAVGDAAHLNFYRSAGGAEIDLVLEFAYGERWAAEIKRTLSPRPAKGFFIACEDIRPDRRLLLYPGADTYSSGLGVEVTSLEALLNDLMRRRGD
jgi:hypothetical protein